METVESLTDIQVTSYIEVKQVYIAKEVLENNKKELTKNIPTSNTLKRRK